MSLADRARTAVLWKVLEVGGVKAISLIRLLILGRALAPTDFGLFAVAALTLELLLSLTDTGTVPALVQRPAPDAREYHVAWSLGLVRGLLIGGGVFAAAPVIANLFHEPRATPLIQALAVRPIIEGAISVRLSDLTRQLSFRPLSMLQLAATTVNTIVSIALVRSYGVWALVAGPVMGSMTYLVFSYALAPYRPRFSLDRAVVRLLIAFGGWVSARGLIATGGKALLQ